MRYIVLLAALVFGAAAWSQEPVSNLMGSQLQRSLSLGAIRIDLGVLDSGQLGLLASGEEGGYIEALTRPVEAERPCGLAMRTQAKYSFHMDARYSRQAQADDNIELGLRFEYGAVLGLQDRTEGCDKPLGVQVILVPIAPNEPPQRRNVQNFAVLNEHLMLMPFVDLAYRQVHLAQADGPRARVSQQVVVAGVSSYLLSPSLFSSAALNRYPKLVFGYYKSVGTDFDDELVEVPDGLKKDHVAGALSLQWRLLDKTALGGISVLLDLDARYSRALDASTESDGWLYTAKLIRRDVRLPGGLTPALIYRTGVDRAFEYDREVLLSIGRKLLGN